MTPRTVALLAVSLSLVACGPPVTGPNATVPCVSASDCPRNLICSAGACVGPAGAPECTAGETRPCGPAPVGACAQGIQKCVDPGVFETTCPGQVTPVAETCNGLDDDCDGQTDEDVGQTWYVDGDGDGFGSSAPGAQTLVACSKPAGFAASNTDCDDSAAGFGIHPGAQEVCDAAQRDENCNGMANEGCGCAPVGSTQQCCAGRGTQSCEAHDGGAMLSVCSVLASSEVCNGVDDDCNGQVDDAFSIAAAVQLDGGSIETDGGCAVGVGACRRTGAAACIGGALACPLTPGTPGVEVCNGIDDNCDGQVDEASASLCAVSGQSCNAGHCECPAGQVACGGQCQVVGGACSVGVGACNRPGVMACIGSSVSCDATPGTPSAEVCDGVDNNCDGQTDEGVTITCDPDEDNDGYASNANAVQQCADRSRSAFGYCPTGYVSPSASHGTDCDPASPNRFRLLSTRDDADSDGYCVGYAAVECVGAAPSPWRRAAASCAATDDCNDSNATLYRNYMVRTDADGDGYCVGLAANACGGSAPPAGTRLFTDCLGDDCRDSNAQATTTCIIVGGYSSVSHTKLCGIGPPPSETTYVSTAAYCPFGFSLMGFRAVISAGGGGCTALTQNSLQQTCNFLEGTTCRVVGDCFAN